MSQFIQVIHYKTDDAIKFSPLIDEVGKVEGVVARYKGSDAKGTHSHILVVLWASQAAFEAFKGGVGPSIVDLYRSQAEFANFRTVPATGDYAKVLSAPIVQISLFTPKEGVTVDENISIAAQVAAIAASKAVGCIFATVDEEPNIVMSILGWPSARAYDISTNTDVTKILKESAAKVDHRSMVTTLSLVD